MTLALLCPKEQHTHVSVYGKKEAVLMMCTITSFGKAFKQMISKAKKKWGGEQDAKSARGSSRTRAAHPSNMNKSHNLALQAGGSTRTNMVCTGVSQ
jgi:hypothetical protein